jgi:DNA polymerase III sliding clamp (beta) subunit (PCNA family)
MATKKKTETAPASSDAIRINRWSLIAAVETCNRGEGLKGVILPVVFRAHKNGLSLRRSVPGGVSARVEIACDGTPDFDSPVIGGCVKVDGGNLLKSLKAATGEEVSFRVVDGAKAEFRHARGKFALPVYMEEIHETEFPDEKPPADKPLSFDDARPMFLAIKALVPFIATDDARPNLIGACINGNRAVATDGHRLSVSSFDGPPGPDGFNLIIEGSFAAHCLDSSGIDLLKFDVYRNTLFASGDGWALCRPRLDGTFPNFSQVIPCYTEGKSQIAPVTTSVNAMLEALKSVKPSVSSKTHNVRLEFNSEGITLTAFDSEKGEAEYQLEASVPDSVGIRRAGFNIEYLEQALRLMTSDSVDIYMPDALSPSMVVPQGETDFAKPQTVSAVVMPMRL